MSLCMYQPAASGIKWKTCANFMGVATPPSTARSPVTITMIPPDGVGCESHVVTLCWTVWNCSVCARGAEHRCDVARGRQPPKTPPADAYRSGGVGGDECIP